MDIWYVIQLITDNFQLINQGVIVPSNWAVIPKKKGAHLKMKYMELVGQGDEDKKLINSLAEIWAAAPEQWPSHLFRILKKAYSWHEAQQQLMILMGGMQNANNHQRIENLLDVSGQGRHNDG